MTEPTPDSTIRAPWTSKQVATLNAFQERGGMHPFACGNNDHGVSVVLMAHRDGWHCSDPACGYRQDWAHAFMADPEAWPRFPFGERHGPTPLRAELTPMQLLAAHPDVPLPPADRAGLRDRIAAAIWERQNPGRRWVDCEYRWRADAEEDAAAVLAVLPPVADRAAVLLEAAAIAESCRQFEQVARPRSAAQVSENVGILRVAAELRRVAAAVPQPETQAPRRGDVFERWLKAQRDAAVDYPEAYQATDGLLDQYRLHADTGTPLGEHVCEGRAVGDCDCLEPPAVVSQPGKDTTAAQQDGEQR